MICPTCGAQAPEDARFCEADGTRLGPPVADAGGCRCGAGPDARDGDGYCAACGRAWPQPGRDHKEVSLSPGLAGVTDRGRRHPRNEDDFVVARERAGDGPATILVVCDGVSSAERADDAAAAAAEAACDVLRAGVRAGRTDHEALMREAVAEANRAVLALPAPQNGPKAPPETTLVAALALNGGVTLGWAGDSRAYRVGPAGVAALTRDHSWAEEVVASGQMSRGEAMRSPHAHAITRCLGLDDGASAPTTATVPLAPDEGLLLCSDGFWNYAGSGPEIDGLLGALPQGADALAVCRALVGFALDRGGRDNITVVLARPATEGTHT